MTQVEKIICIPDLQYPYYDHRNFNRVLDFISDWKPDTVVVLGDLVDLPSISRFRKPLNVVGTCHKDIKGARRDILEPLREVSPKSKMLITYGNHEARLENFLLDQARELSEFPELHLDALLGLKELNITSTTEYFEIAKQLIVTHGTKVSKHSSQSAKAHVDQYEVSVIHGHTHRLGMYYKTSLRGTVVGIEAGHLCSNDKMKKAGTSYISTPNWQAGLVTVTVDKKSGRWHPTLIWVDKKGFLAEGNLYR